MFKVWIIDFNDNLQGLQSSVTYAIAMLANTSQVYEKILHTITSAK